MSPSETPQEENKVPSPKPEPEPILSKSEQKKKEKESRKRARKSQLESLLDVYPETPVPQVVEKTHDFAPRNYYEEWSLLYDFLGKGLDREDACYLRKSYETLLQDGRIPWLSYTHWVSHVYILC